MSAKEKLHQAIFHEAIKVAKKVKKIKKEEKDGMVTKDVVSERIRKNFFAKMLKKLVLEESIKVGHKLAAIKKSVDAKNITQVESSASLVLSGSVLRSYSGPSVLTPGRAV